MVGVMKPIRLIKITSTQDVNGRWVESESASYNIWASLLKNNSSRDVKNGQTSISNTIQFKMYARDLFDVTVSWRLEWSGRRYTVSGIDRIDERLFNVLITATANGKS